MLPAGKVTVDELHGAFRMLGLKIKKDELTKVVNNIDTDGSGDLDYEEFETVMTDALLQSKDERSSSFQK